MFLFTNFSSELKKQTLDMWYKTTWKKLLSTFFQVTSGKIIIAEDKLDSVDVDSIGNVED